MMFLRHSSLQSVGLLPVTLTALGFSKSLFFFFFFPFGHHEFFHKFMNLTLGEEVLSEVSWL